MAADRLGLRGLLGRNPARRGRRTRLRGPRGPRRCPLCRRQPAHLERRRSYRRLGSGRETADRLHRQGVTSRPAGFWPTGPNFHGRLSTRRRFFLTGFCATKLGALCAGAATIQIRCSSSGSTLARRLGLEGACPRSSAAPCDGERDGPNGAQVHHSALRLPQ